MQVCHFISGDLWAGAEAQALTLLRSLQSEPDVDLLVVTLNSGRLVDELQEAGIEVHVIDESQLNSLALIYSLRDKLGKSTDILHTHGYKENLVGAFCKKPCELRALVSTVHGSSESFSGFQGAKMAFYQKLNRHFLRHSFDAVIGVSHVIGAELRASIPTDKVFVIHNSIDPNALVSGLSSSDLRLSLDIPAECPLIGCAGRLVGVKRLDIFLEGAKLVREQVPDAHFIVAGDGPMRAELSSLCQSLEMDGVVHFLGHRDDIAGVLGALDIYALTSDHEGIPVVVLEAMSLKKAVVAAKVGGLPELIEDNVSGLLLDNISPRTFAEACIDLLGDEKRRDSLGANAAHRVINHFSTIKQKDALMGIYRLLLSQTS